MDVHYRLQDCDPAGVARYATSSAALCQYLASRPPADHDWIHSHA